jgi:hypothetical protein
MGSLLRSALLITFSVCFASTLSAATFTVTDPGDSGPGTLHQAVLDASSNPGPDVIRFQTNVTLTQSFTISFVSDLEIDGDMSGTKAVITGTGLNTKFEVTNGANITLRNLRFEGFSGGLQMDAGFDFTVASSVINTNVLVVSGHTFHFLGNQVTKPGTTLLAFTGEQEYFGNTIDTFEVQGPNTRVGNLANGNTIRRLIVRGGSGSIIEGNTLLAGSSGPNTTAILIENGPAVPNAIVIDRNVIDGYATGVAVTAGNDIRITRNSIRNTALPIDLASDGRTPNDPAPDADAGPNDLQNFPVITNVIRGATQFEIEGTLTSVPSTTFVIELFSNPRSDPRGTRTFLEQFQVTTDASGNAAFSRTITSPLPGLEDAITATAIRYDTGDTSEVSAAAALPGDVPTLSEWALIAMAIGLAVAMVRATTA